MAELFPRPGRWHGGSKLKKLAKLAVEEKQSEIWKQAKYGKLAEVA